MPQHCTVCAHPERLAIEREMMALRPFRDMAGRFGLSKSALFRHHDEHLSAAIVKASRIGEIARADDLVDRIIVLARETQAVLDRAKAAEDDELVLKAIARAEKQLELQGKLLGQIKEGATVNVTLSVEWLSIRTLIVGALDRFPEARLAVARALEEVGGHALDG